MAYLTIGERRRDGRYPVTITFAGAPNAFGGFYPNKVYRKIYTLLDVQNAVAVNGTPEQRARFKAAPVVVNIGTSIG